MADFDRRPDPERLLRQAEAEERAGRRGRLKVFLGYASGVGKSHRMLDEGRRRRARGQDVVVGAVQSEVSAEIASLLSKFELIPQRADRSMDLDAVLRRSPGVCLIDGLAYRNPPGARHPERWQDVEELLAAGISVIATVNLQYVRERQSQVEAIRGRRVEESIPEAFLRTANEIEVVDAPAASASESCGLNERQLSELREIALLLAAEVVDAQLEEYLSQHGVQTSFGAVERILVCVTARSDARTMIARARRQAERFHGELFAVHFDSGSPISDADRHELEHRLKLARESGAQVHQLRGEDFVTEVLEFSRQRGVRQIYVGHSQRRGWLHRFFPNPVERLIAESPGIDIRVFPSEPA